MFFVSIDNNEIDLKKVKLICQHILEWDSKHHKLDDETREKLRYITKPTVDINQNVSEINRLFLDLENNLVITNDKGKEVKFYRDYELGMLFFGDEEGLAEARLLNQNNHNHNL